MSYDDSGLDVSAADRLGMTIFFAAVLHAAAVLGISFELHPRLPANQSVEITLAQYSDEKEPEKADFLAQANQQGSGTEAEKKEITSPSPDNHGDREADVVARPEAAVPAVVNPLQQQAVVSATDAERLHAAVSSEVKTEPVPEQASENPSLLQQSLEIASLEAKFLEQRQAYAKRPRVTRLTSVSARKTSSAYYMDNWRKELERIGNINYPEEARRRQLKGRVRVMVALETDGRVSTIEIMESSGHKILDDAVTRIIRLAEPFAPFSDEMRLEMDRLEIIRTFDFGSRLSSF